MVRPIAVTPEEQEAARVRYEEKGESLKAIAPSLHMAECTLAGRAKKWGWRRRAGSGAAPAPAVDRVALTARLRQAVERELATVERRLGGATAGRPLGDSARTLASLVKTLAELNRLETAAAASSAHAAEEDDGAYGDLDALRRELARRIAGLRERGPE